LPRLGRGFSAVLVFAGMLGTGAAAHAEEDCHLGRLTSLDLRMEASGLITVPAQFAGRDLFFMVDTGGAYSTVSTAIAAERHLSATPASLPMRMMGGSTAQQVWPDTFTLGRITSRSQRFFLQPSLMNGIDGMVGANILRNYDADFDFAGGKLNLLAQDHCPGKVVYWTEDTPTILPFDLDRISSHVRVTVRLDGKEIPALVDTGSSLSLMSLGAASRYLDLNADSAGMTRDSRAVNGQPGRTWRRAFQRLELGDIAIEDPTLLILGDAQMQDMNVDLVLGMDVLRRLHLYIAYGEEKLYLTPAGAH
jgi:predicted aspartyl protease